MQVCCLHIECQLHECCMHAACILYDACCARAACMLCCMQNRLNTTADGKWPLVGDSLHVSASSLDELCSELRSALADRVPDGTAVRVVSVKDEFEDDWVPVTSLNAIGDSAKLRLKTAPAQPLQRELNAMNARLTVGKPVDVLPILSSISSTKAVKDVVKCAGPHASEEAKLDVSCHEFAGFE